jgi:hypothetical protein
MNKTGTSTPYTLYLDEEGKPYWPCRCGETHTLDPEEYFRLWGNYNYGAPYEWGHHNCLHFADLMVEPNPDGKYQVMCPDCGMAWVGELIEYPPGISWPKAN